MPLQFSYPAHADIPEALREHYMEREGAFVLAVEGGVVPAARHNEFRENNVALRRQVEDMTKRFGDLDPEAARKALATVAALDGKQLLEAGKVDELVAQRTEGMRAEHKNAIDALTAERDGLLGNMRVLRIDNALREAAAHHGVRAAAVDDVLLRGRNVFDLRDGNVVALDGERPRYGKDGEPLTIKGWVKELAETAGHLFEPSKGGGAAGGSAAGGTGSTTMTRAEFDALPPARKAQVGRDPKMKFVD